jgi:hypothetical protein
VIAAGITLIAAVMVGLIWLIADAMGWKGAAATLGFSLMVTALLVGGALLIEAGMQS